MPQGHILVVDDLADHLRDVEGEISRNKSIQLAMGSRVEGICDMLSHEVSTGEAVDAGNIMLVLAELKALIFGFVATIVASHKGLSASGGPKGVADAVNQSVVLSVILLAVVNVGITQAYVMLVPQGVA